MKNEKRIEQSPSSTIDKLNTEGGVEEKSTEFDQEIYPRKYCELNEAIKMVNDKNIIMDRIVSLTIKVNIRVIHNLYESLFREENGTEVKQLTIIQEIVKLIEISNLSMGNISRNTSIHTDKALIQLGVCYRNYINTLEDKIYDLLMTRE